MDGSVLINQRIINLAAEYFRKRRSGAPRVKMHVRDVFDILYLIDLYVVCPNLSVDGTVPASDVSRLQDELEFLSDHGLDISCFRFDVARGHGQLVAYCAESFQLANLSIRKMEPITGLDDPLSDADAISLAAELDRLKQRYLDSPAAISERPAEVAGEILRSGVRGAKMLAGLAALGPEAFPPLLESLSRMERNAALGMMINRFRFFYLRKLAFSNGDIFSPGDRWRPLSSHQALLYYNFVRDYFQRTGEPSTLNQVYQRHGAPENAPFPPIGLFALMTADGPHPRPLLNRSTQLRAEFSSLRGYLSKENVAATSRIEGDLISLTTDDSMNVVIEQMNAEFGKRLRKLEERRVGLRKPEGNALFSIAKYLVPAAIGLVAESLGAPEMAGIFGALLGSAAVDYAKDFARDTLDKHHSAAIDQYRNLYFSLFQNPELRPVFGQRVEEMFNCELIFG